MKLNGDFVSIFEKEVVNSWSSYKSSAVHHDYLAVLNQLWYKMDSTFLGDVHLMKLVDK